MSYREHNQQFIANCTWMAGILGPEIILSLEHNTSSQGAEYCNTLGDIVDAIITLRSKGAANVGLNLDTKCLMHEFGEDVQIGKILSMPGLSELVTSIQVSYDFLARDVAHRAEDQRQLCTFTSSRNLPLSLEEFGLLEHQLKPFIEAWH